MREEIAGEKIILRRYELDFVSPLYEAARESQGDEFSRWMPWCHENYSFEESEFFIKKSIENWERQTEFNFAVFDRTDSDFLGGVGLNQFNHQHSFVNLGYWIRTSRQNRGAATEAARILAQASFEDLPVNRIEILTAVKNEASQKTALKAAAKREGVLRKRLLIGGRIHDAVMFSFVREDFNL